MNISSVLRCGLACVVAAVTLPPLAAAPVAVRTIADLVNSSDLVIAGTVASASDSGSPFIDGQVRGKIMIAHVNVSEVIKGALPPTPILELKYRVPNEPSGYGTLRTGAFQVIFVKRDQTAGSYEVLSPYYPAVIASPGKRSSASSPYFRVLDYVVAVLDSNAASIMEKREAIYSLRQISEPNVLAGLDRRLSDRDYSVQLAAAAALLFVDDVRGLPIAEEALLRPSADVPREPLQNVRAAIKLTLKYPAAIPSLSRLLAGGDVDTRRAASAALRHSHSSNSIRSLSSALDDSDRDVQYNAVMGLSEITGQREWGPSIPRFQESHLTYIEHWKEWARSQSKK